MITGSHLSRVVLLVDIATEKQIGLIGISPSGLLVFSVIVANLHPFALKPIEAFLKGNGLSEPLYVKHADKLDERKELPLSIIQQEADHCADIINQANPPLSIANFKLKAKVVHYDAKDGS